MCENGPGGISVDRSGRRIWIVSFFHHLYLFCKDFTVYENVWGKWQLFIRAMFRTVQWGRWKSPIISRWPRVNPGMHKNATAENKTSCEEVPFLETNRLVTDWLHSRYFWYLNIIPVDTEKGVTKTLYANDSIWKAEIMRGWLFIRPF